MLKQDFKVGQPFAALSARWLNEVAGALNSLRIEYCDEGQPRIERPTNPSTLRPWKIRIPRGGGIPDGTLIPGRIAIAKFTLTEWDNWDKDNDEHEQQPEGETPEIWLLQYWMKWSAAKGAFEEVKKGPGAKKPTMLLNLGALSSVGHNVKDPSSLEAGDTRGLYLVPPSTTGTLDKPATNVSYADAQEAIKDGTAKKVLDFTVLPSATVVNNAISKQNVFVVGAPGKPAQFAFVKSTPFAASITYKPPTDEYTSGAIKATSYTANILVTSFADTPTTSTLLETEVAEANDASSYESGEES
jgi:hypothetical protein